MKGSHDCNCSVWSQRGVAPSVVMGWPKAWLDPIHTDKDDELQLEALYYYDLRDGTVIHIIVKIPLELIKVGLFEVEKVLQRQL